MSRRVKEFVEIADQASIDQLIERLTEIRATLPPDAEPEMRLCGDDVFGRRITISYLRPQTAEEAELEQRYADAQKAAKTRELERLQQELGVVCYAAPGKRGTLRIVA
jgi:hypothetical protein